MDAIDPTLLVSSTTSSTFDLGTMSEGELHDIRVPLSLTAAFATTVHGIACWFDVLFDGSTVQRCAPATTAPLSHTGHCFITCKSQQGCLDAMLLHYCSTCTYIGHYITRKDSQQDCLQAVLLAATVYGHLLFMCPKACGYE